MTRCATAVEVDQVLKGFLELPVDWNSYDAIPPCKYAALRAKIMWHALVCVGFKPKEISLGADVNGGVAVNVGNLAKRHAWFSFDNDGDMHVVLSDKGTLYAECFDVTDYVGNAKQAKEFIAAG